MNAKKKPRRRVAKKSGREYLEETNGCFRWKASPGLLLAQAWKGLLLGTENLGGETPEGRPSTQNVKCFLEWVTCS